MKVSLHTLRDLLNFELPSIDILVERINTQLGGVEEVIDLGAKYKDALIVRVVECEKHPNADKLSVCKLDVGKEQLVQVVCGAPNVHADMWAVWLPPESIVPETYGTNDEFKLGARELRGVMSNGMLASSKELALGNDHAGILELKEDTVLASDDELAPGLSFAKAFKLDDYIIDIENKMFTHRPDLFGQIGVAREVAAIFGHKLGTPDLINEFGHDVAFESASGLELTVANEALEQVPRFMAVAIDNIEIRSSPLWLQCELIRWGSKPINNIIDLTNYTMLYTGQPTHAYDYDKLRGSKLGARMAKDGEKVILLNDKSYELTSQDIVIEDAEGVVGLAGVMGGGNSEVSADTKRIVIECANFDMYTVRRTSMRHGLFTDAVTRFNKGQSPLQCPAALRYILRALPTLTGGKAIQASDVTDIVDCDNVWVSHDGWNGEEIQITTNDVNAYLGSNFSQDDIIKILENVEFGKDIIDEKTVKFYSPFWRTDIEIKEDIIEEIGRLYGFNRLPKELPSRKIAASRNNKNLQLKAAIRNVLSSFGANELLTYNFIHGDILEKAGQKQEDSYKLRNALSPELQYYRQSITPSLLDKVHANIKLGYSQLAIFELGKSHIKTLEGKSGLPHESERLAFVFAADVKHEEALSGAAYYQVKHYLEQLCSRLTVKDLTYKLIQLDGNDSSKIYFADGRSAVVYVGDVLIGHIGEYKNSVVKAFKLPQYSAGFELDIEPLLEVISGKKEYKTLNKFPSTVQDITIEVEKKESYQKVKERLEYNLTASSYDWRITPIAIYAPEQAAKKHITFRLDISHPERTLTQQEINQLLLKLGNG